ncbi:unnamed protein product [Leuciscus chuanchicus]
MVVQERHLWLCLVYLNSPVSQTGLFGLEKARAVSLRVPLVLLSSAMLEREPGSARNMSAITANDACDACSTPALHLNSTEIYSHSHVDDDDELLKYIWREYLHPKQYEWVLIAGYIMVFLVSLVGNTLGSGVLAANPGNVPALI